MRTAIAKQHSDKGSVMIIGFGLPPLSHEDDPLRAVETALEIHSSLQKVDAIPQLVSYSVAFCTLLHWCDNRNSLLW